MSVSLNWLRMDSSGGGFVEAIMKAEVPLKKESVGSNITGQGRSWTGS
jgi:hypothetical protein